MHIQGVILAGGKSSRMGTNKALLTINNKKVIEHIIDEMRQITEDIIIIANEPKLYEKYNLPIYTDQYKEKGPLAGLETAFHHMKGDVAVVSPCDTPFVHHSVYQELLKDLKNHDAVVPKYDNQIHPLAGIYLRSVHPYIEKRIENNQLRMTSFFEDIDVFIRDDFSILDHSIVKKHFFNMNSMEDYNEAKRL